MDGRDGEEGEPGSAAVSTFASLRVPTFRLIRVGGFLYFLAIFAQMVATGRLALELSGSNTGLGAVTMAFGLASLLTTPFGGVIADRLPKRRVLVLATSLLTVSGAFLAAAILTDVISFWMLMVASAVEAVAFSLLVPSRMALTVMLVGPGLLLNAVVLSQISMNANRILGPAVAGGLMAVSWSGPGGVPPRRHLVHAGGERFGLHLRGRSPAHEGRVPAPPPAAVAALAEHALEPGAAAGLRPVRVVG